MTAGEKMQGYLFPLNKLSHPNPYDDLIAHLLPGAKRSVFLIDPSPPDELVKAINVRTDASVTKRMLIRRDILNTGDAVPPDIMKPETRQLIQNARIEVRAVNHLSARLAVIDDSVLIISGQYDSGLNWGIELNATDSQPVIDYWNSIFQNAVRISDSAALEIWDRYLDKLWSGDLHPHEVVALYNNRGAFVEIQVRIFSGYRQMTLYPFCSSPRDVSRGPVVRWKMVDSRHYRALGRHATRVHGLKSLAIVRDTPAGFYLLRSDTRSWNELFQEREKEFMACVADYVHENYPVIREEAFRNLHSQFFSVLKELKKNNQLLPIMDKQFVEDEVREIFEKHYPDKETLSFACQARYILYGLHPDSAGDRKLMETLCASAVANVLL